MRSRVVAFVPFFRTLAHCIRYIVGYSSPSLSLSTSGPACLLPRALHWPSYCHSCVMSPSFHRHPASSTTRPHGSRPLWCRHSIQLLKTQTLSPSSSSYLTTDICKNLVNSILLEETIMNRFSRVQISAMAQRIWRSPLHSGDALLARRTMESC